MGTTLSYSPYITFSCTSLGWCFMQKIFTINTWALIFIVFCIQCFWLKNHSEIEIESGQALAFSKRSRSSSYTQTRNALRLTVPTAGLSLRRRRVFASKHDTTCTDRPVIKEDISSTVQVGVTLSTHKTTFVRRLSAAEMEHPTVDFPNSSGTRCCCWCWVGMSTLHSIHELQFLKVFVLVHHVPIINTAKGMTMTMLDFRYNFGLHDYTIKL